MRRGETSPKKNDNNNIPADKTSYVQKKGYSFAIFQAFFQTMLNSLFIDAVYTSEILFSQKIFAQIQVRVIPKCGLYTPVYGICSNSFSHCKGDQKKTVAISQMFNHVQLHVHWMHLLNTRICRYPCMYITPTLQTLHYCPAGARC